MTASELSIWWNSYRDSKPDEMDTVGGVTMNGVGDAKDEVDDVTVFTTSSSV